MAKHNPTAREEMANSLSHGAALLVAVVSIPFLINSIDPHRPWQLLGASIFAATLLLLYSTSTLYHALPRGRAKQIFLALDYSAIYLFIAGSYTPFALAAPASAGGWAMFVLVWLLATMGIALKAMRRLSHPGWSTGLYLALGWLVLIAAIPLISRLPLAGVAWLVAGGAAYSVGVGFFALDHRMRYAHSVWHGFVAAGSACHFVAVMAYAV